jgi:hypothetical protein
MRGSDLGHYLTRVVGTPLLALRKMEPMSAEDAYADGSRDYVRVSFTVNMDFDGILSLEASAGNRSADGTLNEVLFFYRIIDLNNRKELTVYDLFTESRSAVDAAVRNAVFAQESGQAVPSFRTRRRYPHPIPTSFPRRRCVACTRRRHRYDAAVVDISWSTLGLTQSALLTGESAGDETGAATDDAALGLSNTTAPTGEAPQATATPTPTPTQAPTLQPLSEVVTPTPMPVTGSDAQIVAFLTRGCGSRWARTGTPTTSSPRTGSF